MVFESLEAFKPGSISSKEAPSAFVLFLQAMLRIKKHPIIKKRSDLLLMGPQLIKANLRHTLHFASILLVDFEH